MEVEISKMVKKITRKNEKLRMMVYKDITGIMIFHCFPQTNLLPENERVWQISLSTCDVLLENTAGLSVAAAP